MRGNDNHHPNKEFGKPSDLTLELLPTCLHSLICVSVTFSCYTAVKAFIGPSDAFHVSFQGFLPFIKMQIINKLF